MFTNAPKMPAIVRAGVAQNQDPRNIMVVFHT